MSKQMQISSCPIPHDLEVVVEKTPEIMKRSFSNVFM